MSRAPEERRIVRVLADRMRAKLRANSHKTHWRDESVEYLLLRLHEEVVELEQAVRYETSAEILDEAADVANMAAMVADVMRERP